MRSDRTLINFNCPNDLMDSFDEVCDFKSMNRTQTLIELMRDYVVNKSDEIKRWLIMNISDKSKTNINNMDHDDLLNLFLETSFEMLGMTFKHKNGRRG